MKTSSEEKTQNDQDKKSILETLKFCHTFISESGIKLLEEVKVSGITPELLEKHHNLLKHRYNLDKIAEDL